MGSRLLSVLVALAVPALAIGCATIAGIEEPHDRTDASAQAIDGAPDAGDDTVDALADTSEAEGGQGGGRECGSGSATCADGACETAHTNGSTTIEGLGQTFSDCNPPCAALAAGGSGEGCTQQEALAACAAFTQIHGGTCSLSTCCLTACGPGVETQYTVTTSGEGDCGTITWTYYADGGSWAGNVFPTAYEMMVGAAACYNGCIFGNTGVYWR